MRVRMRRHGWAALSTVVAGCGRIAFSDQPDAIADVPPDPVDLVSDDFERTDSGSWGIAPVGGAWDLFNPDGAAFFVSGGLAHVRMFADPTYADATVSPSAQDVETRVVIEFDQVPTAGWDLAHLSTRVSANSTGYALEMRLYPDASLRGYLVRSVGGQILDLTTETTAVTGVAAGERIALAVSATGTNPTVLCARIWREATPEPAACTFEAADRAPELATPGSGFLVVQLNAAPSPATVSFDAYRYRRLGTR